ncbi:Transposase [Actinacidiphila yanglinensis]|uniref:Transposase n=1 Tax=Actinacidiphila yanglinensis TaxID=310779 RepID=A0A1H5T1T0_9ACTN|nr:IS5 family transposase [Actinacidiphila yanglinensis]SEF56041.1 Transposase [Actinacidiphila yanglinensis]
MGRGDPTNDEWARLTPHLPKSGGRGGRWNDHRTVINGILFRIRTGVPWRDPPNRFGSWKTVHERHRRWSADVTWERILQAVQADAGARGRIDWRMVSVDSTSCRAHQHAPKDQRANRRRRGSRGGQPAGFDKERYKRRNEVERTINRLKHFRVVATRYGKRAHVFHGTVTVASIRLWLSL